MIGKGAAVTHLSQLRERVFGVLWAAQWPCLVSLHHGLRATLSDVVFCEPVYVNSTIGLAPG